MINMKIKSARKNTSWPQPTTAPESLGRGRGLLPLPTRRALEAPFPHAPRERMRHEMKRKEGRKGAPEWIDDGAIEEGGKEGRKEGKKAPLKILVFTTVLVRARARCVVRSLVVAFYGAFCPNGEPVDML